jgi:hypothetical protein
MTDEIKNESIHTYKKKRDRALLPSVCVALGATALFIGRGLWHHDMTIILDGLGWLALTGFFYIIYRKTLI